MIRIKVVFDGTYSKPWSLEYSLTNAPVDDRRFATIEEAGAALRQLVDAEGTELRRAANE